MATGDVSLARALPETHLEEMSVANHESPGSALRSVLAFTAIVALVSLCGQHSSCLTELIA